MKHNGNLKISGKIASKKIIIGDFSGTSVTSGSYELPYPIGNVGNIISVSLDVSGNKVIKFNQLDASTLTYTPSAAGDWEVVPNVMSQALDVLANGLNFHLHNITDLYTSELDGTYVLQPNGLGGVMWNPMGAIGFTNYYTKTQTNAISAYLQTEIDYLSAEVATISANMGASKFTTLTDAPSSYVGHAGDTVTVNPTETGLTFVAMLYGTVNCDLINQAYTVNHSKLTANSKPIVSLTIPSSAETQYIATPVNIRTGAFDVVLSDIPMVSGYSINWFSFNNI